MTGLVRKRCSDAAAVAPAPSSAGNGSALEHYRERLKLDRHALDFAAESQPELFLAVAEQHVLALSRLDAAKDELTRLDARLARDVRKRIEAEGGKTTEGRIADEVLTQQEHIDHATTMSAAKIEADNWSALRTAYDHRLRMIRELVSMYSAGYYTATGAAGARTEGRNAGAAAGREALAAARQARGV